MTKIFALAVFAVAVSPAIAEDSCSELYKQHLESDLSLSYEQQFPTIPGTVY